MSTKSTGFRSSGVGSSCRRTEDKRHLAGRGSFIADMKLAGLREIAFVRSVIPHGRIREVTVPAGPKGTFWTGRDMLELTEQMVTTCELPGYKESAMPNLAYEKVRYVGEPLAAVVADSRAEAEDLAEQVVVDIESLPAVRDYVEAMAEGSPRVHEAWDDNIYLTTSGDVGDVDDAARSAAVSITREHRMHRQGVLPLETRGIIAHYDRSADQLVIWSGTQMPHMMRDMTALLCRIDPNKVRVIAPDIGGAFGAKCSVYPEDIVVAAIAMQVEHPVRWVEDRYEAMVSTTQARDQKFTITAHASADGTLLGLEAEVITDSGAYSMHPWSATMDSGMSSAMIPGPYRVRNYRHRAYSVASTKTPSGPYRGVGRPGACFAIERTIEDLAHELGIEPHEFRAKNMVRSEDMPYTSVAGKIYDSGDYPEAVRRAVALLDHDRWRRRQHEIPPDSRTRIGIGYGSFTEQTAHGCIEWATRGLALTMGTEGARLSMDAGGTFTLAVGIKSHGQGSETTLAQVVSEIFDVDPSNVTVIHGDTSATPRGDGTFGSRTMVMSGGATYFASEALGEKVKQIGAVILDENVEDVRLESGSVVGENGKVSYAELSQLFLFQPNKVPGVSAGLEVTYYYRPENATGAFTYATHGAVVEVDLDTGQIELLDYCIVDDCGVVVNPLIVEGQVLGGIAQGIGTALLEEMTFDVDAQPNSTTFLDYSMPVAPSIPDIKVEYMVSPSPKTVFGMKGAGEGGIIAPPAAIGNAVTDALREFGVGIDVTPMTPLRVWTALDEARSENLEGRGSAFGVAAS